MMKHSIRSWAASNAKDQQPDPDAEDLLQQLMPLVARGI